jgi:hypothetical protein
MAVARRTGAGAYLHEWHVAPGFAAGADALLESIIEWCRATLGATRRPWGINEFDLAIAVARDGDPSPRSLSLQRLSPAALYGELEGPGAVLEAVRRLLDQREGEPGGAIVHVAIALFSWGDAAHAALPQGQPAG